MLRPIGPSDSFGSEFEGGTPVRELVSFVRRLQKLKHIRVDGLTSFPSFRYDLKERKMRKTSNFDTLKRCQEILRTDCSIEVEQINAPGNSCAAGMTILAEEGGTHAEPGHAFTGTTPWHAFQDLPEIPAWLYVTEVSHVNGDRAYAFSGGLPQSGYYGFFTSLYHQVFIYALVGDSESSHRALSEPPRLVNDVQAWPDLYTTIHLAEEFSVHIGDTVVFGFRPQVYVTRSKIAIVKGIGTSHRKLLGIFDRNGNLLSDDEGPAPRENLHNLMKDV
jgi:predicted amino acid racemase